MTTPEAQKIFADLNRSSGEPRVAAILKRILGNSWPTLAWESPEAQPKRFA